MVRIIGAEMVIFEFFLRFSVEKCDFVNVDGNVLGPLL